MTKIAGNKTRLFSVLTLFALVIALFAGTITTAGAVGIEIVEIEPTVYTISVGSAITGGTIAPSRTTAFGGETVKVEVTPAEGNQLVRGSLKFTAVAGTVAIGKDGNDEYAFTMPKSSVILTAQFESESSSSGDGSISGSGDASSSVWDGKTIDIKWYTDNPSASSFTISTPAELAGLAAIVNGLYNAEIDTIRGNSDLLKVNRSEGRADSGEGNNLSTPTFHWGIDRFNGKTIRLGANIDMGTANYMPIGGQYLMTPNDSTTRIDASFNGTFDGSGYTVNIFCDRHANGNYGDGSSIGLIGRLGVHDNDDTSLRASSPTVKNVIVTGYVSGNRSVGGIVGKIGKTNGGGYIDNCVNYASIEATDAKGVGGIVGSAWNGGRISNSYNGGSVSRSGAWAAGGIAGTVEIEILNSYSYGTITAPKDYAMGIGTNNGGGKYTNSYYLDTSAADGGWYSGGKEDVNLTERTIQYMRSEDFVKDLGSAYSMDTTFKVDDKGKITNSGLNNGYPILKALKLQPGTAPTGIGSIETPEEPETTTVETVVEVPATVDADGRAVAKVDEKTITDAVESALKAIETAEKAGVKNIIGEIILKVKTTGTAKVKTAEVDLVVESVKAIAEHKGLVLTIDSEVAKITLDNATLAGLASGHGNAETVKIIAAVVDNGGTALNDKQKEKVGVNSVVDLSVLVNDVAIRDFKGTVTVSVPYTPPETLKADDYDLLTVYYLDADGNASEMKGAKYDSKTGTIIFKTSHFSKFFIAEWISPFADIAKTDWFYKNVRFAYSNELMQGTDKGFEPQVNLTRAMLITVLVRNAGIDTTSGDPWYAAALEWGIKQKVTDGTEPESNITREQLVTMLYRYANPKAEDGRVGEFADIDSVSDWATDAVKWAIQKKIINGYEDRTIRPQGNATRAEIAAILQRFLTL